MTVRAHVLTFVLALAAAILAGAAAPASAATQFTIEGRGWGHGVGMSQWGAKGLAEKGLTGNKILFWYYRGTALTKVTTPPAIRVGLLQEQDHIDVTGNGRFDIYDQKGTLRAAGASGQTWRVRPVASGTNQLAVYNPNGVLSFTSAAPVTIRYENRGTLLKLPQTGWQYKHGRIDLDVNTPTGKERAILIVPFEQYLYGLGEMPASWAVEALKAQAIAGRTYALDKINRLGQNRAVCNCAVYASTADQVYDGTAQEVPRWVSAVDYTRSQVVTYNGKPIQAYYASSSGGFTENNENVFGGTALPYLRGTCDPGDYDGGSNPHANWSVSLSEPTVRQKLAGGGYSIGTIQQLQVLAPRGVSGRVLNVVDSTHGGMLVRGSSGSARINGSRFSALLGLQSTLLSRIISGDIRLRYDGLNCAPGLAAGDEFTWNDLSGSTRGTAQNFALGRLFRNASTHKVFWTKGAILARYDALRQQGTDLGLPVSDEFGITGGRRSNFERGYITWNASNGQTSVILYH